jgi:CheY-like chemotaxis protein
MGSRKLTILMGDGGPDDFLPVRTAPSLILVDLGMPKVNGQEALREIKTDPMLRHIPVVVSNTSHDHGEILTTHQPRVSSSVVQPATYERVMSVLTMLLEYWVNSVEPPDQTE